MILPIRCFSCGKVIGQLYHIKEFTPDVFEQNGIHRYCCKKTLLTSVSIHDNDSTYSTYDNKEITIKKGIEDEKILFPK